MNIIEHFVQPYNAGTKEEYSGQSMHFYGDDCKYVHFTVKTAQTFDIFTSV